ncbi:MAG: RagB/SusD family nutrient uptake outer membrane protein, partial [Bacteroidia bacterium]|nr:RagB/SusD family nutrient uptake outer membrane protein [Bacteroidia bacterium]
MKQKINKIALAVILTFTVVVSCDKKLNVLDQNNPTQESYFNTAAELQNGVNAVYSILRAGEMMGREWFFLHDMRGGETNAGGPQLEAPRAELLFQNNATPSNAVMTNVWNGCYQMINRANLILSKAPGITDNTSLRDRLVGEAEFLRAWAYFELVSQWGDVPMYTDPIESSTDFKGKEPSANIYSLVLSDLADAVSKLPATYGGGDLGRATKGAANALLGRVQMQKGDYAAAKTALLAVVNSNLYSLVPNYLDNFDGDVVGGPAPATGHEFNSESVFEVAFYDKGDNNFNWAYNGEGSSNPVSTVRPQDYGIVWGNVIPSNRILNEYEAGDPRYRFSVYEEGDQILTFGGTMPGQVMTNADMNITTSDKGGVIKKRIYRKYLDIDWIKSSFHPGGINQRVIRYADILLMLAECEAETGTPAQAAAYINMVRSRPSVNMPPVVLATKPLALKAVMHERAVELACESVANIDILRWRAKGY